MLRPANDALRRRKAETATTVAVLSFALFLPCMVVLAAAFVGDAASSYLQAYRPVIYLSADAGNAEAAELADELSTWTTVGDAEIRTPDDAFETLQQRLGDQEVAKLGVSANMLPYSVILEPSTPVISHLDLIASVSGLEARMEVESVDVPSPRAAQTLSFVRWLLWLGALLLLVLVVTGISQARAYLLRLEDELAGESELLALFGAPPPKLSRPTLVRGVTIGAWAGAIAFGALFIMLLMWQDARPALVGIIHGSSAWSWAAVAVPVVLGPLFGVIAAWFANRSRRMDINIDEMELQRLL
jgi:cell division protein FtsX